MRLNYRLLTVNPGGRCPGSQTSWTQSTYDGVGGESMKTWRAFKFLIVGPMILALLVVINWMTSPGEWWVQWAALGIGIAWVISLFRVVFAAIVAGGLVALFATLKNS